MKSKEEVINPIIPTQEQKQETIEEASKKFIDLWFLTGQGTTEVFIAGAEWQKHQSEKMFSNEEVIELFTNWNNEEYGFTNVFVEIDGKPIPIRELPKIEYEEFLEGMHRLRLAYIAVVGR